MHSMPQVENGPSDDSTFTKILKKNSKHHPFLLSFILSLPTEIRYHCHSVRLGHDGWFGWNGLRGNGQRQFHGDATEDAA